MSLEWQKKKKDLPGKQLKTSSIPSDMRPGNFGPPQVTYTCCSGCSSSFKQGLRLPLNGIIFSGVFKFGLFRLFRCHGGLSARQVVSCRLKMIRFSLLTDISLWVRVSEPHSSESEPFPSFDEIKASLEISTSVGISSGNQTSDPLLMSFNSGGTYFENIRVARNTKGKQNMPTSAFKRVVQP